MYTLDEFRKRLTFFGLGDYYEKLLTVLRYAHCAEKWLVTEEIHKWNGKRSFSELYSFHEQLRSNVQDIEYCVSILKQLGMVEYGRLHYRPDKEIFGYQLTELGEQLSKMSLEEYLDGKRDELNAFLKGFELKFLELVLKDLKTSRGWLSYPDEYSGPAAIERLKLKGDEVFQFIEELVQYYIIHVLKSDKNLHDLLTYAILEHPLYRKKLNRFMNDLLKQGLAALSSEERGYHLIMAPPEVANIIQSIVDSAGVLTRDYDRSILTTFVLLFFLGWSLLVSSLNVEPFSRKDIMNLCKTIDVNEEEFAREIDKVAEKQWVSRYYFTDLTSQPFVVKDQRNLYELVKNELGSFISALIG